MSCFTCCKHFHSWFLVSTFLIWRITSQTAPFGLRLGDHQLERKLKKTEGGEKFHIRYFMLVSMASSIWGGVPGPPEYGPGRPRTMYNIKQTIVEVFACLDSSHGFLSTIFGILGKFWIDIGKNIFRKYIFFKTFFFGKTWKYFQFFFLTKNENFEKSKFWKFRNFGRFSKFWNFEIFIFCQKKIWKYFYFFPRFFFGLEKNIFTYINSKFPQDSKNRT